MLRENGTVNSAFYFTCNDEIMWDQGNGFFNKSAAQKTGERRRLTKKWLDAIAIVNYERGYTPTYNCDDAIVFSYWDRSSDSPCFKEVPARCAWLPLTHHFHKDDLTKLCEKFHIRQIKLIYLGE